MYHVTHLGLSLLNHPPKTHYIFCIIMKLSNLIEIIFVQFSTNEKVLRGQWPWGSKWLIFFQYFPELQRLALRTLESRNLRQKEKHHMTRYFLLRSTFFLMLLYFSRCTNLFLWDELFDIFAWYTGHITNERRHFQAEEIYNVYYFLNLLSL